MKNILVPIDFSNASHYAGKYAVSLADVFNTKVIFLNVVPSAFIVDDESAHSRMMAHAKLVEDNKNLVVKEMDTLSKKHFSKIEGFVGEGTTTDVILEMAKKNDVDLIVMGMKGKGKSNSVFGSTTTAIIRKSSLPVLVIPENTLYLSIDKITIATDFDPEPESERYSLLIEIAKKYNSFISILNVQKNEMKMTDDEFIGKMRTYFSFTDSRHSFNTIEDKSVTEGISKFIEENSSDLLAMIAHKHSFFERMLGKVHTKEMSYETKIPLLVLQSK
jgi:nucleotide-binding universal stress UspA family protein